MAPWGRRARSATNQWSDQAPQIAAAEASYRTERHMSSKTVSPQAIAVAELPAELGGVMVRIPRHESIETIDDLERLEASNPILESVAAVAQFGLDLLYSTHGHKSLMKSGFTIMHAAKDQGWRTREPDKIAEHAADFLQRVTETFPVVVVRDLMATNGSSSRRRPTMGSSCLIALQSSNLTEL